MNLIELHLEHIRKMKQAEVKDKDTQILINIIYNMRWYLVNYASGLRNTPEECMTDELRGRQKMAEDALKYLVKMEHEQNIFI